MKPRRTYLDYIQDIKDAAEKAQCFLRGISLEEFLRDDKTAYATIRALTIIGEAANKIPRSLQTRYPHIPWREMAAMRDKLAHDYFGVDLRRVYETVGRDIPPLLAGLEPLLTELEQEERDE